MVIRNEEGEPCVVKRVAPRPGRFTFRVEFLGASRAVRDMLVEQLERGGCRLEWYSSDLFRVDVAREPLAQQVSGLLMHVESLGHLTFESGRPS